MATTVSLFTRSSQPVLRKGEVRASLLALLSREPHAVTELSKLLGVSKATVSYHLNNLVRTGQIKIASEETAAQGFIKKYYIASEQASSPLEEKYVEMLHWMADKTRVELEDCELEPLGEKIQNLLMGTLHVLQYITKEKHGQLLRNLGFQIGENVLSRRIRGRRLPAILRGVKEVLEGSDMGIVSIMEATNANATLRIFDCFECVNVPNIGEIQCSFDEGSLTGILQAKLGPFYSVKEVKCQGTGHPYCEFRIGKAARSNLK
ncbi:MAG: V4R domain-containing protein [Candidatus Bathyarchaeia archaeon]